MGPTTPGPSNNIWHGDNMLIRYKFDKNILDELKSKFVVFPTNDWKCECKFIHLKDKQIQVLTTSDCTVFKIDGHCTKLSKGIFNINVFRYN